MSGICIDKIPHSCGTRDGLQVFADPDTGKVDGFCFSCSTYIGHPYGKPVTADDIDLPEPKTPEQIALEIAEVDGFQTVDIRERKLRAKYLERFGVKVAMSEEDGRTPSATYFPIYKQGRKSGYYIRSLGEDKYQWSIGDVKGGEPFGWQEAKRSGAHTLIIFEGKEDAVAGEAVFDRHGKEEFKPACISLPNGTNSVESSLSQIQQEASRAFRKIIICFDDDKAGHRAEEKAMQIFPKAHVVRLPEKDMNDCLIKGCANAAFKALAFNSAPPKNSRLILADKELHLSARNPTPWGELTWPWPTMNDLTRNIRYGETIYLGAGVKMSKSEIVNTLGAHFMKAHQVKVFMAKPEEELKKTYKMVCGKMVGQVFHDPKIEFDYGKYDEAGRMIGDNLILLDLYQHIGWETLKMDIVSAAAMGCKVIFIDPITNLTNGMNAADANTHLQQVAQDLSAMAMDLDIVIFIFCHLKAHDGNISPDKRKAAYDKGQYVRLGNCQHERGGDVLSSQFAGSRSMMRSCNLMLGIEGNKDNDLPEHIRNMRYLSFLEDREFGNTAMVPLSWDKNTQLFKEA
jgi:twinkle protein